MSQKQWTPLILLGQFTPPSPSTRLRIFLMILSTLFSSISYYWLLRYPPPPPLSTACPESCSCLASSPSRWREPSPHWRDRQPTWSEESVVTAEGAGSQRNLPHIPPASTTNLYQLHPLPLLEVQLPGCHGHVVCQGLEKDEDDSRCTRDLIV